MPLPRPALAALGLITACAACCAAPLMAGLVAAGGAGGVVGLAAWLEFGAIAALGVLGIGAVLLWRRRRAAPACSVDPQAPGSCSTGGDCGSGCR